MDIKEVYYYYEKLIPFIKEDIINNVPFSEFSKLKLVEMLHCLGKKTDLDTFIVIKIKEDNLELSSDLKKIDKILDLIKKHLNNVIHEEDFIILPLSNNKISIVLRILKNNADKHIYILEVMEEIRIELAKKTKSSVTIGVGRSYKKIEDLKISYHEALNAQQYAEQFGSGIIHVENINEFNQYSVRYPVKEKEKMISLIKLGDIENGRIALNEFIGKFKNLLKKNQRY